MSETEATVPESISLNDLQLLLNIVDLSTQRGAFRGNELTQVGAIFDKLNSFLTHVAAQQAAAAEANGVNEDQVQEDQMEEPTEG